MKTLDASTLRRSKRIAGFGCAANSIDQAQIVLMRKLGILAAQDNLTQDARDAYARLFEHPLSRAQLTALASLFGWVVPEQSEACSANLLLS